MQHGKKPYQPCRQNYTIDLALVIAMALVALVMAKALVTPRACGREREGGGLRGLGQAGSLYSDIM